MSAIFYSPLLLSVSLGCFPDLILCLVLIVLFYISILRPFSFLLFCSMCEPLTICFYVYSLNLILSHRYIWFKLVNLNYNSSFCYTFYGFNRYVLQSLTVVVGLFIMPTTQTTAT